MQNDRDTKGGNDSLEIDEDVPELVARAINQRTTSNLNDGDDGSRSKMP